LNSRSAMRGTLNTWPVPGTKKRQFYVTMKKGKLLQSTTMANTK
jgi:hypothetical protein